VHLGESKRGSDVRTPHLTPWVASQSGNLNGRPVGSRTVFSPGFLKDLAEVWASHGKQTMISTAQTNPAVFFATCARLIGPEVKLTIEQSLPGNLSMEDWQIMKEVTPPFAKPFRMLPIGQPAPSLSMRCQRSRLNCPKND
jgi:hypothetical protein